MNDNWIEALCRLQREYTPAVIVTLIEERGSTPRNSGTKMVVTGTQLYCTIGGGHLEYRCCDIARQMLSEQAPHCRTERFSLGASLGQCCGGMVTVLFEPVNTGVAHIALFGAGHVAKALIPILASLPCTISWIDARPEQFPTEMIGRVNIICEPDPLDALDDLPAGCFYIIMTHDHQLDFTLVEHILKRNEFGYLGLIGSQHKRARFDYRLAQRGVTDDQLAGLHCPIGLPGLTGKHPGEIAVAIAGQIIACYQSLQLTNPAPQTERLAVRNAL